MQNLIVCGIDIPIFYSEPVGIVLSGGADSSLLFYILAKNIKSKIYVFTYASNQKARITAQVSTKIIEKVIQLTENNNISHITDYGDTQNNNKLFATPFKMLADGSIKYLYTGITANPPDEVLKTFKTPSMEQGERDPTVKRPLFYPNKSIITPWTNIDKKKIKEIYEYLNLTDSLFPLTRSCEALYKLDYFGHCGSCWWCEERYWAFGRYN